MALIANYPGWGKLVRGGPIAMGTRLGKPDIACQRSWDDYNYIYFAAATWKVVLIEVFGSYQIVCKLDKRHLKKK